jgi:hypothetical protein
MESVYLETTFISYLVARPSRDVIIAGHQQTAEVSDAQAIDSGEPFGFF